MTLLIEEYLQLSVYAFSCMDKLRFDDSKWAALSFYEAITLLYLPSLLMLVLYLVLKFTANHSVYKQKQQFFIFDGIKAVELNSVEAKAVRLPTRFAKYFFPLFMLRRLLFAAVIVFLRHSTKIQLGLLILLAALQIIFLSAFRPL